MTNKEILETDLDKDERLQIGFYLNDKSEAKKLNYIAKQHGLNKSAVLRMLILKEWRKLSENEANK